MSATLYQLCHTLTFFTKVVEPICSIDCTIGEGSHVAQLAEPAALAGLNVELIKQIFLLLAEFGGRIHNNSHDVGATSAAAQVRNTVSAQFKIGAALRAGRNFHAHRAVDGFDINLGAQCRLDHTDMLGTQNEVAFARKLFVCPNADAHVQVAFSTASDRFAVFAQADGSAVVDAGRDFQGDGIATKKTFKNVAESQIAKVEVHILAASPAKTGKRIAITRRAAAHAGMPKLVVTLAFGRIF